MTSSAPSQCLYCARRFAGEGGTQMCEAYPGRIPAAIWANQEDHRTPQAGDGGLRWKPAVTGDEFPDWALSKRTKPPTRGLAQQAETLVALLTQAQRR